MSGYSPCKNCGISEIASTLIDGICEECIDFTSKGSRIEAVMITTETTPNLNITKRIEVVTAECAFGMNMFKDLFAGVRNVCSVLDDGTIIGCEQ